MNLAASKPSTASSVERQHVPGAGNDSDLTTRWCASSAAVPQWWQVDLLEPCDLTGAQIKWEKDGHVYQYILEGSADNRNWQTLSDQQDSTDKSQAQNLKFTAQGIRYVRIRITSLESGCWASFFELEVFGK